MTRRDVDRLHDIQAAIDAIRSHLARGDLKDGLIVDAVRVRLIEIGEAVKDIDNTLLDQASADPRVDVARMRDRLAHRYFDTSQRHRCGDGRS